MSFLSFIFILIGFAFCNLLFVIVDVIRAKYDDLISDYNNKRIIKNIYQRCKRKWAKDVSIRSTYKSFDDYVSFEINKKFDYEKYIGYYTWGVKIGGQEKEN